MLLNYEDIIFNFVTIQAPVVIVFMLLALILDYMRQMLFCNR